MLVSMTGYGEARLQKDDMSVRVEVRSVNNRFLKVAIRSNQALPASVENELELLVRKYLRRGTVQLSVFIDRPPEPGDYRVNGQVLLDYWRQLAQLSAETGLAPPPGLEPLLMLPGVISEREDSTSAAENWLPTLVAAVEEALQKLQEMRLREGQAMAADMREKCQQILAITDDVEKRAPLVVENYRKRLQEHLSLLLGEAASAVKPEDIVKEAGIYAERVDISEEIVRLRSHVQQFLGVLSNSDEETPGRRLEFLTQEIFREINTMGAKANDAAISRCVVEMKTLVERLREMIQNVE